jgi:glycosyltransferase involved in cell wall biosynthesis
MLKHDISLNSAAFDTDEAFEPTVTVLIPCLNEEQTLEICISKAWNYMRRAGLSGEIVIADNGSTDASVEIAERLGARVAHIKDRGYGAALRGGIEAARGRYIIMGDADDSYDFSDLSAFVTLLEDGADLVMGNRFQGGIDPGAMPPLHRYLGNPVLSWLGRLLFAVPVGDFHCGLRGFRRTSILDLGLRTSGMEFASEMVVQASLRKLNIKEVPTRLSKDGRDRPPHLNTWRDGWRHLRFLLLYSPRWTFAYPGGAILAAGLLLVGLLINGQISVGGVGFDIRTFLVGCLGITVGSQALTFAFLARRFAGRNALLPSTARVHAAMEAVTMERLLQSALIIAIAGVAGVSLAVLTWSESGFGPIENGHLLRIVTLSVTAITVAVQLALSAFLLGVLDLTVSGDDARARLLTLKAAYPSND